MAFSDGPALPRDRSGEVIGEMVVFSRSELIGDGLAGLLPREWRPRISVASDLAALERSIGPAWTSVIIAGDSPAATEAVRLTRARGGSAIVLLGSDRTELEPESLAQADAILERDETEALALRIAIAAGRLGLRLVPRTAPAAPSAEDVQIAALSDTARRALALLADGMRDADIAGELHLSESAVRKLIQRTVRALGARTRCQAVAIAARDPHANRLEEPAE
jgi:DNA-binding NarL/FixJ family response regulator